MSSDKLKIPFSQVVSILTPYIKNKIFEQIRAISTVVLYMVLFQIFFLKIPMSNSIIIAIGIGLVALGLTFFLEGLLLGMMPLGEFCGQKLLQNSIMPFVLFFGFLLDLYYRNYLMSIVFSFRTYIPSVLNIVSYFSPSKIVSNKLSIHSLSFSI